jgi:hypothetical protein
MTTSTANPLLVSISLDPTDEAANDGPGRDALASEWTDVNLMVATTVARVSAQLRPLHVNVALDLDGRDPMVRGDATALAFALSGTLGALIRTADQICGDHDLKVRVTAQQHHICVAMVGDELPSLEVLRALVGNADPRISDPTVAHCRRLIEAEGGSLVLEQQDGEIALALRLPVAPATIGPRVPAPRRKPSSRSERFTSIPLAA